LPDGSRIILEWVRNHLWSEATRFEIPREKVIHGLGSNIFSIEIFGNHTKKSVVCKRIVAAEIQDLEYLDAWKAFFLSIRSEIKSYELIAKQPDYLNALFTKVLFVDSTSKSLDLTSPKEAAFLMVFEDLRDSHYQLKSLNMNQAIATLKSLSKLHTHFWNDREFLQGFQRGGKWNLARSKKLNELKTAESSWKSLLINMPELRDLKLQNLDKISSEIVKHSDAWDRFISRRCQALIHGDLKSWNLFFNKQSDSNLVFIDFQWMGKGHPLQDVADFLTSSLDKSFLHQF